MGADEIEIVLEALNYVEWNVARFKDYLSYFDNNLLIRYAWEPVKTKEMIYKRPP